MDFCRDVDETQVLWKPARHNSKTLSLLEKSKQERRREIAELEDEIKASKIRDERAKTPASRVSSRSDQRQVPEERTNSRSAEREPIASKRSR